MKTIAVASGKGGTGKTFFSTNLFGVMEQSGISAAVVDCDAEVPNVSVFIRREEMGQWMSGQFCPRINAASCTSCGICADHCSFNAITCIPSRKFIRVMPELCHGCRVCIHDCPSGAIEEGWKQIGKVSAYGTGDRTVLFEARIDPGQKTPVPVIRDAIRKASETGADFLILDAPPGCSCPFVNTVIGADHVILVSEPTPFGLSDLRHTVEVLRRMGKSFDVVINRSDLGDGKMKTFLEKERISLLAEIPFSEKIARCYSDGQLAAEQDPEIRHLFMEIMKKITDHETGSHQR